MVQSIFDESDDEAQTPGAEAPLSIHPVSEPSELANETPEPYLSEPFEAAAAGTPTPLDVAPRVEPPPTQLDGSQRFNLYSDPAPSTFSDSTADTVRRSGLAWSAGVVFLGSVVFMLFLGWGADLILGSSPWGLVAGIVLGSTIGFVQFFRISSQIFPASDQSRTSSIVIPDDDDSDRRL